MWELVPADPPVCDTSECRARGQEQASVTRLGSGWFASDPSWGGSHDGDTLWMHAGGEWVSLAELGMERPADPDGAVVHKSGIGNTTMFWSPGDEPNPGSLWILDLEPRG